MIIGLDFDNTIACYDSLVFSLALEEKWIGSDCPPNKLTVRNQLRKLPEGDVLWQKIQGKIYGVEMHRAEPFPGVLSFFEQAFQLGHRIKIVSHKTEFSDYDPLRTPLRRAALDWLLSKGFFSMFSNYFSAHDVIFQPTREKKIQSIVESQCAVFFDDLVEVFLEPGFPAWVKKFLFAAQWPEGVDEGRKGKICLVSSWDELGRICFED